MEENRTEGRSNWKSSIMRPTGSEIKIFGKDKELPTKFSPAKHTNEFKSSRSMIHHLGRNSSQDEINLRDSKVEGLKRGGNNRLHTLETPRSEKEQKLSYSAIVEKGKGVSKLVLQEGDIDIIRRLRSDFNVFKERILKELKQHEENLKKMIKEIYAAVLASKNIKFRSQIDAASMNELPSEVVISEPKILREVNDLGRELQQKMRIMDLEVYKKQFAKDKQRGGYLSNNQKIKEKLSNIFETIQKLKAEVNSDTNSQKDYILT